jgi:predicted nuclease with TOPRIM domain
MTKMELIQFGMAGFGTGTVVIGAMAYKIWRMLKADGTSDVLNKSAIELIEVYKTGTMDAEARTTEMRDRLEVSERERNEMSEQFGKLRSDFEHVSSELVKVSAVCVRLELENKILLDALQKQSEMIELLVDKQDMFLSELRGMK